MTFPFDQVVLRTVRLPLKEPFRSPLGTVAERESIIVELQGQGISGWGEAAPLPFPGYSHETPETVRFILGHFLLPQFFQEKPGDLNVFQKLLNQTVGNPFARASLEMAYWDWLAKSQDIPLYQLLSGTRTEIQVGVAVGLHSEVDQTLAEIEERLTKGYARIKIKIAPGNDVALVAAVFKRFPSISLMVDANSAYRLSDLEIFRALDEFPLLMIEQPLGRHDFVDHAALQQKIKHPICLDESIEHLDSARTAIALKSCRIINIKPGRVGGLAVAKAIHDICAQQNVGVWCGGMLETGIGRAHNMALATLPNFSYPGDISGSSRYFDQDIVEPEIQLSAQGSLKLSSSPGIGVEVSKAFLQRFTTQSSTYPTR